ncbi:MAG: hypothetical protein KAX50_11935, partial [Saprospiraceae bacterium]|nr:hypothetical protein [Saprospiraceae bacterium]
AHLQSRDPNFYFHKQFASGKVKEPIYYVKELSNYSVGNGQGLKPHATEQQGFQGKCFFENVQ